MVRRVAEAARLSLTDEELERYEQQLKVILEAFRELDEVDTEGVEPSFHPVELEDVLREDKPSKWVWDPLANSEHKEDGYFRGPRIQ
ncbi:Asp-tRNA(Asn)/Glu-tRNA(Gln) amidotransferase subunit GatC [Candidatus Bathyarchaeota archaeon]|nr:Asp-tRNA(Asn)/Glu-tRNA(Gln) amidotransferase subunit GatC [Candidatus Bathyarchaeota archaeon]